VTGRIGRALAIGALIAAGLVAAATLGRAAAVGDRALYTPDELAAIYRHSPLGPPPPDPTDRVAGDAAAAAFGQALFFTKAFSANGRIGCVTCHQPARAFTDGRAVAQGLAAGTRHTPSLLNAAYNHWYFWDGRADSLWSQALQPWENPKEAGGDRLHVLHVVARDPALAAAYRRVFGVLPPLADLERFPAHARPDPDPALAVAKAWASMSPADRRAADRAYSNLGKAVEAYDRLLVSGASPFDRYVAALKAGDPVGERAISPAAKRGLKLFVGAGGCELCHSGPFFSDGQFHNLGLPVPPGAGPDPGRAEGIRLVAADPFNAIGAFSDDRGGEAKDRLAYLPKPETQLGAFKTPTLRNVAVAGPYLHDGRFATLARVIRFYAEGKAASRGRLVGVREQSLDLVPHLGAVQQSDLVAFLETLTGAPVPARLTGPPAAGDR
jgi:cytochrome c peroxidase